MRAESRCVACPLPLLLPLADLAMNLGSNFEEMSEPQNAEDRR